MTSFYAVSALSLHSNCDNDANQNLSRGLDGIHAESADSLFHFIFNLLKLKLVRLVMSYHLGKPNLTNTSNKIMQANLKPFFKITP